MAAPEWLAPFAERLRVGAPAAARLATRALFSHLRERPALDATPALRRCDATYCASRGCGNAPAPICCHRLR